MGLDIVLGVVRALLAAAGGGLLADGVVTGSQWQDISGGILAAVTAGWSWYQHKKDGKTLIAVANAPAPTSLVTTVQQAKAQVTR